MLDRVAVYDACVLYPPFLRDFLMWLAVHGKARGNLLARWTGRIHREWTRAVLRRNPSINRRSLNRLCRIMDGRVTGCRVRGYQRWEPRLTLPDPDDRHVLAAALACVADVIVTNNLQDFPAPVLAPFGVAAVTPDDFVSDWLAPGLVAAAAADHRHELRRPPMSPDEYRDALRRRGLPKMADALANQAI